MEMRKEIMYVIGRNVEVKVEDGKLAAR